MPLTKHERGTLYWACLANGSGMGLYGPSLERFGDRVTVCEELIRRGLLRNDAARSGYWLTDAGRCALQKPDQKR